MRPREMWDWVVGIVNVHVYNTILYGIVPFTLNYEVQEKGSCPTGMVWDVSVVLYFIRTL